MEAEVYINESDIYVCTKLVEDLPAVFSLGRFCNEKGSYQNAGEHPQLTKDRVIIFVTPKTSLLSWE